MQTSFFILIFRPPDGCTQWFTEPSGTISDWAGADDFLQDSLDYEICVRQNMGYCCVEYTVMKPIHNVRGATAHSTVVGIICPPG